MFNRAATHARKSRAALVVALAALGIALAGCSTSNPAPAAPAEGEVGAVTPEAEPGFVPLGEWHQFSNGARVRVLMREISLPADAKYPEIYPAVDRALAVRVEVDNTSTETIGNVFSFGARFATLPGEMTLALGRSTDEPAEFPRLIRPGTTASATTVQMPQEGTEWPAGAEFTCVVRTPLPVGQKPTLTSDETAEWIGVPDRA